ncbi:MAG: helix-turn-helix transcriptional regulator [Ruminiclostridium sp.]|nr:helix-turn-helix transcriptional regulator [Ruminiclostridium sp.]
MNTPYFVPIVSAVLRSGDNTKTAIYLGETVFGVSLKNYNYDEFAEKLCQSIAELGIYIAESEIDTIVEEINDSYDVEEKLAKMYSLITEKSTPRSSEAYSEIFSNLRKEMKYSPQNNWSISDASVRTGLSGSHFQRLYKKHFGNSFTEELISFRMERAKYLLKNTSMSVQRIAEECGYTNSAHFMRQFKEREGKSAGQYRKEEKGE